MEMKCREKAWDIDKRWSDRFLPEIKQILGLHLIGEPPIEEDQERNTDLVVLKMEPVRIGCRVRRPVSENGYLCFEKHSDEFTIRAGRPSGIKTELTKIIEGWGNYFFYAFSDHNHEHLMKWVLCNLNIFRLWFNRELVKKRGAFPTTILNHDNSSNFIPFRFVDLPPDFIVAEKEIEEKPLINTF